MLGPSAFEPNNEFSNDMGGPESQDSVREDDHGIEPPRSVQAQRCKTAISVERPAKSVMRPGERQQPHEYERLSQYVGMRRRQMESQHVSLMQCMSVNRAVEQMHET